MIEPAARAARDKIVLAHAGWARKVALLFCRRLRIRIAPEEAISAANLALVQAAGRYLATRGATFMTYAHRRIEGAVLDHAHHLSGAYRLRAGEERHYPPIPLSIEDLANQLRGPNPHGRTEARHVVERLLGVLSPREREVLRLLYVEDLALYEVGKQLGITESRVCQIRVEALGKMRGAAVRRQATGSRRAGLAATARAALR